MSKQTKTKQDSINKNQKYWDNAGMRLYYREANSFTARQSKIRWENYYKLSEKDRDFWRAKAQQFAQNYPTLKESTFS